MKIEPNKRATKVHSEPKPTSQTGKTNFFERLVTWYNKPGIFAALKKWWNSSTTTEQTIIASNKDITSRKTEQKTGQPNPRSSTKAGIETNKSEDRLIKINKFDAIVNDLLMSIFKDQAPFNDILTEYRQNFSKDKFPEPYELIYKLMSITQEQLDLEPGQSKLTITAMQLISDKFDWLNLNSEKYMLNDNQKDTLEKIRNKIHSSVKN